MGRRCARCVYDDTVPSMRYDADGVCQYCHQHDLLDREFPTGAAGQRKLEAMASEIRAAGRGKRYDLVVGVSGGCDSSYLLHLARQLGLRPLAVHFDNTWNSTTATENIHNLLETMDVDLFTYVVHNKEYDDIYRSFLEAGVPDTEAPTDLALAATLNIACEKYGVRYIFEGHSFRTEGIAPLGWIYMDGRYIKSVHERHGKLPMKTYPAMPMHRFIKWTALMQIKKIRPLYWIDYHKESAKELLAREYRWKWYGGHHLENRFTAFWHTVYLPRRYGIDTRLLGHAALVRSGQLSREEALAELARPQVADEDLLEMVLKRLKYSPEKLQQILELPRRTYRDYDSYKTVFEWMRPFWWLMYKLHRVPKSFYIKFCFPDPGAASAGTGSRST